MTRSYFPRKKYNCIEESFWGKVEKIDGCWKWKASFDGHGYGQLRFNDKHHMAHKLSYQINIGEVPAGSCVCHKCDNPGCVNPDHLFLALHKENMQDMISKNRDFKLPPMKGSKNPASKLTEEDVRRIRTLAGQYTNTTIGTMFHVSGALIGKIISRKAWKHI